MKSILMTLLLFFTSNVLAWNTRAEFEAASIRALQNRTYLTSENFQTQLVAFIESPVDEDTRWEARIVQAAMNNILYRQDMNFNKLTTAYDSSTNFFAQANMGTNTWCEWGYKIAMCGYYGNFGQTRDMFNLATNMVSEMTTGWIVAHTNCISQAFLSWYDMPDLTPVQAFQTVAVMSAAVLGEREIIPSYTNNLPPRVMTMLREILGN